MTPRPLPAARFALYLILPLLAAGCERSPGETEAAAADCVADGALLAEVYGAFETTLDWRSDKLECNGMPRPHGQGARLHFAGTATANGQALDLAFIIALPGLQQGRSARELSAGVTLIEQGSGRFFSTPEPSTCWADIERQVPLDAAEPEYRIKGLLYCVSPLAEVNGTGSVTLTDLQFSGRLNWQVPE